MQTDIDIHTYIYIYNLCMYVANTHGSRCRSNFKAAQAFGLAMATHRLSLLCRKTRVLPAEVFRLVRDFLLVHVGASCPLWINCVLEAKLYALPRSVHRLIKVSFHASKTIEYGVYRQDEFEYGRTSRPRHRAMHGLRVVRARGGRLAGAGGGRAGFHRPHWALAAGVPAGRLHAAIR